MMDGRPLVPARKAVVDDGRSLANTTTAGAGLFLLLFLPLAFLACYGMDSWEGGRGLHACKRDDVPQAPSRSR